MKVSEAMKSAPITGSPDMSVKEAATLMSSNKVGSLLIVENGELVGIMTERDILNRVVMSTKNPENMEVREIMSTNPITITEDETLEDAAKKLTQHKIKKLPVVQNGKLIGIITDTDIVSHQPGMIKSLSREIVIKERTRAKKKIQPLIFTSVILAILMAVSVFSFVRLLTPLVENNLIPRSTINMIFLLTVFITLVSTVTAVTIYVKLVRRE
jgi:CBS domain-containing protein